MPIAHVSARIASSAISRRLTTCAQQHPVSWESEPHVAAMACLDGYLANVFGQDYNADRAMAVCRREYGRIQVSPCQKKMLPLYALVLVLTIAVAILLVRRERK